MNKFPIGPIQDSCTTPDATPVSIATTFLDLLETVVVRAFVVARRPDTMASKGWQLSAMVKRLNGTCSVESLVGPASPLVSAGDATPMSGCAVSINGHGRRVGELVHYVGRGERP